MNLSVLERMAREGDLSLDALRFLLGCRAECEWLDYKEALPLDREKNLCDFARDVLAIKNVGGGYIVVGVEDKTWKPVGLHAKLAYDGKLLRDQVRRATGVDLDIDIVQHELQMPGSSGLFALVFVRASRKRKKRRSPTMVAADYCAAKPFGLRRGEIYVRRGDSTLRVTSDVELEELLENLESQADQDAVALSGRASPFAVEAGPYRLLEKGFHQFVGRDALRKELLDAVTRDPRIWIINVHGPGGVGKSALVNWAVYEFYEGGTFEAIVHLTAKDTVLTASGIERCSRSLYSLENLLDHVLWAFDESPPQELAGKRTMVHELLSAWRTLLVLDNMETVQDGRILEFVQQLPVDTLAKVLMTSRQKTGAWELPFSVSQLTVTEVHEFLTIRSREMTLDFPRDEGSARRVWQATGGLPLAIQWLLGRYKIRPDLDKVVVAVNEKDSPVLEFSFRNIWQLLSADSKAVLAILTIFDAPPCAQQVSVATGFPMERVDAALAQLADVTLITRHTQLSDGRITFSSLPITLSFARNQLNAMGDFEVACRQRYQKYTDQMNLHESELSRFKTKFKRYGLETDNEKRAAMLCQRGENETFSGNVTTADMLFKQARELAPQCAYVHAMSASYELVRNRIGNALGHVEEACRRATTRTGALCFTIKARILDVQHDKDGRVAALSRALEYEPEDAVVQHQFGVALSRAGRPADAIREFSKIIDKEASRTPPTVQLLMALKPRIINLRRIGREGEAQGDIERAMEVFRRYPHLASEADHFAEFFDK